MATSSSLVLLRRFAAASGGASGAATGAAARTAAGFQDLLMRTIEPKVEQRVPASSATLSADAATAQTYGKLMMKRHRAQGRDLQRKLRLKWAAVYAIPTEGQRRAALAVEPYVPTYARVAGLTPPIAGWAGIPPPPSIVAAGAASLASLNALTSAAGAGTGATAVSAAEPPAASLASARPAGASAGSASGARLPPPFAPSPPAAAAPGSPGRRPPPPAFASSAAPAAHRGAPPPPATAPRAGPPPSSKGGQTRGFATRAERDAARAAPATRGPWVEEEGEVRAATAALFRAVAAGVAGMVAASGPGMRVVASSDGALAIAVPLGGAFELTAQPQQRTVTLVSPKSGSFTYRLRRGPLAGDAPYADEWLDVADGHLLRELLARDLMHASTGTRGVPHFPR